MKVPDLRLKDSYPVEIVVGDLHSEAIPTSINRTVLEYAQLRKFLDLKTQPKFSKALDFGCGYGRMIPFLHEISETVHGIERDSHLRELATCLNPDTEIFPFEKILPGMTYDLVLTYTFMQHLEDTEFEEAKKRIISALKPGGYWLAIESKCDVKDFELPLLYLEPRVKEATNPNTDVGTVMLFRKPRSKMNE